MYTFSSETPPIILADSKVTQFDPIEFYKDGVQSFCFRIGDGYQIRTGSSLDIANYIDRKFHENLDKCWDYSQGQLMFVTGGYWHLRTREFDFTVPKDNHYQFLALQKAIGALAGKSVKFLVLKITDTNDDNTNTNIADAVVRFWKWCMESFPIPVYIMASSDLYETYSPALVNNVAGQENAQPLWMIQPSPHLKSYQSLANYLLNGETISLDSVATPGFASFHMVTVGKEMESLPAHMLGTVDFAFFRYSFDRLLEELKFDYIPTPPDYVDDENDGETGDTTDDDVTNAELKEIVEAIPDMIAEAKMEILDAIMDAVTLIIDGNITGASNKLNISLSGTAVPDKSDE